MAMRGVPSKTSSGNASTEVADEKKKDPEPAKQKNKLNVSKDEGKIKQKAKVPENMALKKDKKPKLKTDISNPLEKDLAANSKEVGSGDAIKADISKSTAAVDIKGDSVESKEADMSEATLVVDCKGDGPVDSKQINISEPITSRDVNDVVSSDSDSNSGKAVEDEEETCTDKTTEQTEIEKTEETKKVASVLGKRKHEETMCGKEQKKEKKEAMPVRSLTDEEYEIIFSAAIQRVMNMDIDAWTPKCTSPKKAFVPKSKKYKITVGKPVESSKENKPPSTKSINGKVKPVQEKSDSTKPQKKDNQKVNVLEEKKNQAMKPQEEVAEENSDSDNQNVDNWVLVEIIDDQPQTTRVEAQIENETTPAVSGDELVSLPVVQSPPRKKAKKLDKIQKKKVLNPDSFHLTQKVPVFQGWAEQGILTASDGLRYPRKTHMKAKLYSKEKRTKSDTLTVETVREKKTMGQKMNRRKEMLTREINLKGTWVQCCKTDCMKWRYLPTVSDPSSIPDYWTCIMNTNDNNNSCDKPEEDYDESEHIYAKYCEGSVVSAKMAGYPWWPAMIEADPDTESYFQLDEKNLMLPTHYHVVFLDDKVSRTWLKASQIRIFNKEADQRALLATSSKQKKKSSSIEKELNSAQKNAMKALEYPIQERIKVFGFAAKFKGSWGTFIPNDEVVQEKPKIVKTEHKPQIKEELIDDSTMDDVLDNTEALLSNVEEMLDSLDSHLADSDEDSDFSIDELVCVEGRKKKSRNKTVTKRRKPSQIYLESSDDESEAGKDEPMEICAEDNDELSDVPIANKGSCDKVDEVENKTGGVHEGSACSFAFNKKLKLDSEIFTMELDDQEDKVELDIKDDEKVERENKNKAKDITDNTQKNDDFSKGEMKKNKQAKKKSLKTSGNICRDSSGKTNLKSDLNDINKDNLEKKEEERKNSSESCIEDFEKTPICDAQTEHEMDGHKSESSDSDSEITSELDNQKELGKANNESKSFSGVPEIKSKCDKQEKPENPTTDTNDDTYSVENPKNQNPTADDFPTNKKDKKIASDDSKDSQNDVNQRSMNDDDNLDEGSPANDPDSLVPDLDLNEGSDGDGDQCDHEGISLEDETEVDLDLGEQSMYDGPTTGGDKVVERSMMIEVTDMSTVQLSQEDSDPFDMIEE